MEIENGVGLNKNQLSELLKIQELKKKNSLDKQISEGLDAEVYHHPHCPGLSNSNLTHLKKSMRHLEASISRKLAELSELQPAIKNLNASYKKPLSLDSLGFGNFVHDMILLPELFEQKYFVFNPPEMPKFGRKKEDLENKNIWIEANEKPYYAKHQGKTAVSQEDFEKASQIKTAFSSHPVIGPILKNENTKREVTFFSQCKRTGVLKKCRADLLLDNLVGADGKEYALVIDLKTTNDASPVGFSKAIVNFDYDRQAAYYSEIIEECLGKPVVFCLAPVEKEPPFGVTVQNTSEIIEVGKEIADFLINYYAECKKNPKEAGYEKGVIDAFLPAFGFDVANRKGR